jgi:MFS family permease
LIGTNTHVSADENGYVANANRMLSGVRYATFKWPPGTSFAFALATRLSGHHSLRLTTHAGGPAQYVQLALGVFLLALVAALVWLLAGPWAAVIATALVASYEPLIDATRTFLSEPAGAFLLLAAVGAAAIAHARLGRRHDLLVVGAAGATGGFACLTRGDLAVGMGVLALALALAGRPGWRRGLARGGVYLGALLLVLAPWLAYASYTEGRFVPITTAGPDAFFIGTYLPGKGLLVPTEEQLAPEVCRHFPSDCGRYWQRSSRPLFRLIEARHPGVSENAAVNSENLQNIRRYALGKPAAFASMLWGKFWKMWVNVWSGGNGTYHADTSRVQHLIYLWLAWIGLLAGAILTRRFALVTSAAVLLSVAGLATLFNDQPRYNVSLMPLLLSAGVAGWWLAGERLLAIWRDRRGADEPVAVPSARTAR